MIKAIIFDYGGTLDSRGDHWSEVIYRAYRAEMPHITRNDFRHAYVMAERALDGTGIIRPTDTFLDVMIKKITLQFTHLNLPGIPTPDHLSPQSPHPAILRIATRCYESARECILEVRPVLETLASRYPLAIVSNFYGNLSAVLADFGIAHLFRTVIDSTTVGIRKPDPAIFRLGIQALNTLPAETNPAEILPSEILVVGDSISKDILPATTLGCPTAHLPGIPWDPTAPTKPLPSTTIPLITLSDLLHVLTE
ncbi:MAG: HAD family hydrolase [Paenibacillus sp.]|nr:HAD family hydrolase [Paenibacillus sp.]